MSGTFVSYHHPYKNDNSGKLFETRFRPKKCKRATERVKEKKKLWSVQINLVLYFHQKRVRKRREKSQSSNI